MADRIVEKTETGELYIETSLTDWPERLAAWKADHSKPCPMPSKHLMFKRHADYGVRPVNYCKCCGLFLTKGES